MVNHVSRYFHQSFFMSLSLVCDTKISMLRVIFQVCKANMKDFVFDRYILVKLPTFLHGQNTRRTSRVSGTIDHLDIYAESLFYVVLRLSIQNENKSQQFTCIHTILDSTLLSISFHLNFFSCV